MGGRAAARVRQTRLDGCQEEEGFDRFDIVWERSKAGEEGDRG